VRDELNQSWVEVSRRPVMLKSSLRSVGAQSTPPSLLYDPPTFDEPAGLSGLNVFLSK
jgi:hypothetical protein